MTNYRNTIVLAALALAAVSAARAADVTGKWKAEFESQIGHLNYTYDLKADSGKLTGQEIKLTRKVADVATEELVAKRMQ